jgi:hypothetical protein
MVLDLKLDQTMFDLSAIEDAAAATTATTTQHTVNLEQECVDDLGRWLVDSLPAFNSEE